MNENYNDLTTRDLSRAVTQNEIGVSAEPISEDDLANLQTKIEKSAENDFNAVRTLVKAGVLSVEEGHNLIKQVIKNAYNSITKAQILETQPAQDAFAEFEKDAPDFFKGKGREDLLNYLKNSNARFDKDELLQISKLVENLEGNAVEKYLKKIEYGKTLNDENAIAKQRLTANAQSPNAADNLKKVFTRAEIGKMSGDEFTKYEPAIMEALRKGLIR